MESRPPFSFIIPTPTRSTPISPTVGCNGRTHTRYSRRRWPVCSHITRPSTTGISRQDLCSVDHLLSARSLRRFFPLASLTPDLDAPTACHRTRSFAHQVRVKYVRLSAIRRRISDDVCGLGWTDSTPCSLPQNTLSRTIRSRILLNLRNTNQALRIHGPLTLPGWNATSEPTTNVPAAFGSEPEPPRPQKPRRILSIQ